jgi:hypothetical protein
MHIDYIICLADGFTMEELDTAKHLIEQYIAKEMDRTAEVHFIPVIPKIEQETAGGVLTHARDLLSAGKTDGRKVLPYEILSPAEQMEAAKPSQGYRAVFVDADSKDDVLAVMRSVKSLFRTKQEIVFAMVTPHARQWRIGEYLKHVIEEHEYMKTHPPEQDPDMRRMDD